MMGREERKSPGFDGAYEDLVRAVFDLVTANGGHSTFTVVCFQEDGPPDVVRV